MTVEQLLQFFKILENVTGEKIKIYFDDWRPGDQYIFISDNSRAKQLLNFNPNINSRLGIELIYKWLFDGIDLKGQKVLEAMCGSGQVTKFLLSAGKKETGDGFR